MGREGKKPSYPKFFYNKRGILNHFNCKFQSIERRFIFLKIHATDCLYHGCTKQKDSLFSVNYTENKRKIKRNKAI